MISLVLCSSAGVFSLTKHKFLEVCIEGHSLFGLRTGVGNFTYNLIDCLQKTEHNNFFYYVLFFRFFLDRKFDLPVNLYKNNFKYIIVSFIPYKFFKFLRKHNLLPPIDLFFGKKIYIFPNFIRWPLLRSSSIVVIHDLCFEIHPEYVEPKNVKLLRKYILPSLKKATRIVAVSESTKNDIIKHYSFCERKISVINPGYDQQTFYPRNRFEVQNVKSKLSINKPYILFVGTIEPRKNLIGLLNAYEKLPEKLKEQYCLVLVGGKGWLDEKIQKKIRDLKTKGLDIINTGYVDYEDLAPLYSGSSLFVFPSHYEGFGIPLLEAMACGASLLASNTSSIPEVVGDAALLVNPDSDEDISMGMKCILTDNNLAQLLKKRAFLQAKKFSWEKSAKKFLLLLETLA